jgi:hypothetical protein
MYGRHGGNPAGKPSCHIFPIKYVLYVAVIKVGHQLETDRFVKLDVLPIVNTSEKCI